jgi:integrase
VLEKAGIKKKVRLYDIRHYYITHSLAGGTNMMDLAERVGHRDTTMIVKVYSHMVDELRSKIPFNLPNLRPGKKSAIKMVDNGRRKTKKEASRKRLTS